MFIARTLLIFSLLALAACSSVADASTVVRNACRETELQRNYDVSGSGTGPRGSIEYEMTVSNGDYRVAVTMTPIENSETRNDIGGEIIEVDDVTYSRFEGEEWLISDQTPNLWITGLDDLCLDTERNIFKSDGTEQIRGIPTRRFVATRSISLTEDISQSINATYWVDDSGLIRQISTRIQNDEGATSVATTIISGVGEPNVITAPTLP